MHLQHNKVTNLRLAASRMDGLVIAPGETFRTWVGERYQHGQLRSDVRREQSFTVEPRAEQFLRRDGQVFRRNQIWRRVIDRRSGEQVDDELVKSNCALVVYEPDPAVDVIDV